MKTSKQTNLRSLSRVVLLSIIVLLTSTITHARVNPQIEAAGPAAAVSFPGSATKYVFSQPVILYHDPNPPATRRLSPPRVFSRSSIQSAVIQINYLAAGENMSGDPCYTWPAEAQTAFNFAASIWESLLNSTVPIEIDACWTELVGNALGSSSANMVNYGTPSTWYQESLLNSILGINSNPANPDIRIKYNRLTDWYYGTDGNTPWNEVDFVSVVLHEIGHGLGFSGSMVMDGLLGSWGWGQVPDPAAYDRFTETGLGTPLLDLGNGSVTLGSALTSGDIYFNGTNANIANAGSPPELYAPATWVQGSSYSHLDYSTFNETINELMVYRISSGESVHNPGPVALGILVDVGWTLTITPPPPTVTSITPDSGFNNGVVHITELSGSNFVNPTVKLSRLGQSDIPGTNVTVVNTGTLTCDFNLDGAALGDWDVVVTNVDTQESTLSGGFTVNAVPAPDVNINKGMIGSDFMPGDPITFTLDIANSGILTATSVVVTDDLPIEIINPSFTSTLDITATGTFSYTWSVEPLHPGENGRITIFGQIDPLVAEGSSFVNTAVISDTGDSTPGNNTDSVIVSIGQQNTYLPVIAHNWPSIHTIQIHPEADATVFQGVPSLNLGHTIDMWVGYHHIGCISSEWGAEIVRSMVSFDLSIIPAGAQVQQATLYLYQANSCDIGQRTHTVTTYRISNPWSELSVTWDNQPSFAEAYGSALVTSEDWGWSSYNVTDLVDGWINSSYPNYGLMLRGPESSGNDGAQLGFYTLDMYDIDPSVIPYLEITYMGTSLVQQSRIVSSTAADSPGNWRTISELLNANFGLTEYLITGANAWKFCSAE